MFKLLVYQDVLNIVKKEIYKKEKSRANDSNQLNTTNFITL